MVIIIEWAQRIQDLMCGKMPCHNLKLEGSFTALVAFHSFRLCYQFVHFYCCCSNEPFGSGRGTSFRFCSPQPKLQFHGHEASCVAWSACGVLTPVPIYTAWWTEARVCEQLAQSCYVEQSGRDSNLRPLGCNSDAVTTMSPRQPKWHFLSPNSHLPQMSYITSVTNRNAFWSYHNNIEHERFISNSWVCACSWKGMHHNAFLYLACLCTVGLVVCAVDFWWCGCGMWL